MSEPKSSDAALDSVSVPYPPQSDAFLDELLTNSRPEPPPPAREGLPPNYKMRNAHYVDELEGRARRLADDEPRIQPTLSESIGAPSRLIVALTLTELTRGLEGLSSCFNLVSSQGRPLRERLGVQLAQVESRRARRLSHSLRVLVDEPTMTRRTLNLAEVLQGVLDETRDEFQLARIDLNADIAERSWRVWGDSSLLGMALSGIIGSLVAVLEPQSPAVLRTTITNGDGVATISAQAQGAVVSGNIARFFDLEWLDRPGGIAAGATLVAARRIAQLHEGRLDVASDPAGLVIAMSLPVRA